jgi:Ser/Thr protein kinase RdoA (MazF antagonist)
MTSDAVQRVISALGLEVFKIEAVSESYSSIVRILTLANHQRVVLKIPSSRTKLDRECIALKALEACLLVPNLLSSVEASDGTSAMVMELLPGRPLPLHAYGRVQFGQVGRALADLHAAPYPDNLMVDASGWWDELYFQINTHLSFCREVDGLGEYERIGDIFNVISSKRFNDVALGFTHFDFREGNILFHNRNITGIVDFESSRYGSTILDFAKFANNLQRTQPESFKDLLKGYEDKRNLPKSLPELLSFYILYQALSCVAWCIKNKQTHREFYRQNRRDVEERLKLLMPMVPSITRT